MPSKSANARALRKLGQTLWLDNISREMLRDGTLGRYIADLSITGLTSNPTIFERAISSGNGYDSAIASMAERGLSAEQIYLALLVTDLTQAAEVFRPMFDASHQADGWVSLEVSPLLAMDASRTILAAAQLQARAACPNLFIKIPGTAAGLAAIEQSIADGVPVNVTLLFSREQYLAAAEAYVRAIEQRVKLGCDPVVGSVASVFVSRWDVAVASSAVPQLRNRLGLAMAMQCYQAYRGLLDSQRWRRLAAAGARPQRLLWASTGTKDAALTDTFYVNALAAAGTINTVPEATLRAFADHGSVGAALPADGGDSRQVIEQFRQQGVDVAALAARLQDEGIEAFTASWRHTVARIAAQASGAATPSAA